MLTQYTRMIDSAEIPLEDALNLVKMAGYTIDAWNRGYRIYPFADDPLRFYVAEFGEGLTDAQKAFGLLDTFNRAKQAKPKGV